MSPTTQLTLAVNIKDPSFFKELGSRIALARKERNITQVQLAQTLGVSVKELIGEAPSATRKRGPAPKPRQRTVWM